MGDQYDAPNQQVVRPDGSGPWDEGDGGGETAEPKAKSTAKDDAETKKAKKG